MAFTVYWWTFLVFTAYFGFLSSTEDLVIYANTGVLVKYKAVEGKQLREKRAINCEKNGITPQEKMTILRRHNELRRNETASDMMLLEWDDRLAASAQRWADDCIFEHSNEKYRSQKLTSYGVLGENLYRKSSCKFKPVKALQGWYNEVQHYNYSTKKCAPGQFCTHYTQMVWAKTRAVGCGVKYCSDLKDGEKTTRGLFLVCHYGPMGNFRGRFPYTTGNPCTQCPIEASHCVQGLCSKNPKIGSDGGSGSSSTAEQLLHLTSKNPKIGSDGGSDSSSTAEQLLHLTSKNPKIGSDGGSDSSSTAEQLLHLTSKSSKIGSDGGSNTTGSSNVGQLSKSPSLVIFASFVSAKIILSR